MKACDDIMIFSKKTMMERGRHESCPGTISRRLTRSERSQYFYILCPPPPPPNNINTAHRGPFQVNVERPGEIFSLKLFKNKMALSKTSCDGMRQIRGARAWWAMEQFRAASSVFSVLFHFSNLTFLFAIHARHRSS